MQSERRGHRAGGLIVAHQARSWRRMRALVLSAAGLLVALELHALMQVAVEGEVLAALRQAMRILCILLCGGILYRFISVAHAVACLRERMTRLHQRLARLEATTLDPSAFGGSESRPAVMAAPFRLEAVMQNLAEPTGWEEDGRDEPVTPDAVVVAQAFDDSARGSPRLAEPARPADRSPGGGSIDDADGSEPSDEVEPEREWRVRLRAALLARDIRTALRIGQWLKSHYPDSAAARDFAYLAPHLEACADPPVRRPQTGHLAPAGQLSGSAGIPAPEPLGACEGRSASAERPAR